MWKKCMSHSWLVALHRMVCWLVKRVVRNCFFFFHFELLVFFFLIQQRHVKCACTTASINYALTSRMASHLLHLKVVWTRKTPTTTITTTTTINLIFYGCFRHNDAESREQKRNGQPSKHDLHFDHSDNNGEEENTVLSWFAVNHSTSAPIVYVTNSMAMAMPTINHPISIDQFIFYFVFKTITRWKISFTHRYRSAAPMFFISFTSNVCHQMNLKCFTMFFFSSWFAWFLEMVFFLSSLHQSKKYQNFIELYSIDWWLVVKIVTSKQSNWLRINQLTSSMFGFGACDHHKKKHNTMYKRAKLLQIERAITRECCLTA